MASCWIYQDYRQRQKLGDKAPWTVGFIDPDGKRRSKRIGSKSMAQKFARKLEGQLSAGVYEEQSRTKWSEFRAEFAQKILGNKSAKTREAYRTPLDHFERICKPQKMASITTAMVDDFIAKRRNEPGKKGKSKVSPATINHNLRHIKAALNVAHEWGYVSKLPRFKMVREPKKLPRYVTPEHFAAIYQACEHATFPKLRGVHYSAADWWRALITFAYMTGWRIGEPLALRRDDLDLENGTAITRADDNKGRRDELVPLHPVVVEQLRTIGTFDSFSEYVFPWPHHERTLWAEFARIQQQAVVADANGNETLLHLPCHEKHEHTEACHVYSFHDFRRAFATVNAETLNADALQSLMRHKSYQTTQRYINMAQQLNRSVEKLHVPDVLKVTEIGA